MKIKEFLFTGKRAKSFYWRAGVGLGLLYCAEFLNILPTLNLPEFVAVALAYAVNELTKWLNTKKSKLEKNE